MESIQVLRINITCIIISVITTTTLFLMMNSITILLSISGILAYFSYLKIFNFRKTKSKIFHKLENVLKEYITSTILGTIFTYSLLNIITGNFFNLQLYLYLISLCVYHFMEYAYVCMFHYDELSFNSKNNLK